VPPMAIVALVEEPLPCTRWKASTPSTVLNVAVARGSSPCAIVAVIAPATPRATTSSAMRSLGCACLTFCSTRTAVERIAEQLVPNARESATVSS